jgi:hypothetical protein
MPYDPAKTRNLLTITGAFAGQPGGEYINDLAAQLRDAEGEITAANQAKLKAEGDANRYAAELATMQATMRQLREENEALKAAATAPKPKAPRAATPVEAAPPPTPVAAPPPVEPAPVTPAKRTRKPKTPAPSTTQ